jgi:hypothetical protein
MKIINLDEAVINALNLFIDNPPPKFDISKFDLPFVIGSGNAYNTGQILFSQKAAIFADESNFKTILPSYKKAIYQKIITQALVISASGGKDSVWELELAKDNGLETTLLTTKKDSDAAKVTDNLLVYESLDEPYTYNTSTYMGMILSSTNENIKKVKEFIEKLELPINFNKYDAYAFVLPDKFAGICPMLDIKKSELFGPLLSIRAFPQGHARHAKFVIRDPKELVISINSKNEYFGVPKSRWNIDLPVDFSFASIMAISYFLIGKIQESKPPYFIENIQDYVSDYGPKAYGKNDAFDLIVPGASSE